MIAPEVEAQILRLFHVEKWRIGTIADQLGVHHGSVRRVLDRSGVPRPVRQRPSRIDRFVPFIQETLRKHPRLLGTRLYTMCSERGYRGSLDHFRSQLRPYRPKPVAEAYLRLRTLPGEQAQVDWGSFGHLQVGHAKRPIVAFVMVLSYSRAIALRFFPSQQVEWFLRGHQYAFARWGGSARVLLYDNLKSAVLERRGEAIRFNPLLIDFAKHYRFEPRPVAVARGNEKGRVERAIRYIRGSFFAARRFRDLEDLNRQAEAWCDGPALDRPWPEGRTRTVREAWIEEQPTLLELNPNPYPDDERREAHVGKTPYVRFDGNDYSVPHAHVRSTVTIVASPTIVRVHAGGVEIAQHRRSYGRGDQVEEAAHVQGLVATKREARKHRGLDRLAAAAPSTSTLFKVLAERGKNLGFHTQRLLRMLDLYGAQDLEHAIAEALAQNAPHLHAIRLVLERERYARGEAPPIAVQLPDHQRFGDIVVRAHSLATYDAIGERVARRLAVEHAPSSDDDHDHDNHEGDSR